MTEPCKKVLVLRALGLGFGLGVAVLAGAPGNVAWAQRSGGGDAGTSSGGGGSNISSLPNTTALVRQMGKYLLGPQDVLSVTVERFPNYSADVVVVPPDGKISLPYFGSFNANNKTTKQLEALLTSRIANRIRNPKVSVSLRQIRDQASGFVNVLGAVRSTGPVAILDGYRLTDVLAKAGGVEGRYDEVIASIGRGRQSLKVDLYQAVSYPQSPANIRVRANDTLSIQKIDVKSLQISGDVARQGAYEMRRAPQAGAQEIGLRPRLADLLVAAGGLTNSDKMLNGRVSGTLTRGAQRIDLDIEGALAQKASANILLQANDFVTVAIEAPLNVNVLGSGYVSTPGKFNLKPGASVLDALALAGGVAAGQDPSRLVATLQRGGFSQKIDLVKLLSGDTSENTPLRSGDTLRLSPPDSIKVYVSGSVASPTLGTEMTLPIGARVYDAIARAGGLDVKEGPAKAQITVVRNTASGQPRFLSIDALGLLRGEAAQNALLESGDSINVVQEPDRVATISGEVVRPGPYDVDEDGEDLANFIARAGGVKQGALLSAVTIKSADGTRKTVDAYDAILNGAPLGVKVRDKDYVVLAPNLSGVTVMEAVNRPGFISLPERRALTVLEAITAAGGTKPNARTQEVALLRQLPNGKTEIRTLPMNDLRKNLVATRLTLQAGDVLLVPEGKVTQSGLSKATSLLSIVGLAGSLLR